ncbi:MAG: hypothetical protein JW967_04885 [Dehalococcoidales bacterium]|nr:hypothetical protein [Dehalococcoidales bacterium]
MRKFLVAMIMVITLVFTGCSSLSGSSEQPEPKILRHAILAGKYQMYQIEVTLKAGTELPLIIRLQNGDIADGYFYVEKGASTVGFRVSGISRIYESDLTNTPNNQTPSDRFSFTASQSQGLFYEMILTNAASSEEKTSTTVFLEIIYPGEEPIAIPLAE